MRAKPPHRRVFMQQRLPHPARCRRRVRARGADTHAGGARRPPLPAQELPHGAAAAPATDRGLHPGSLSPAQACAQRDVTHPCEVVFRSIPGRARGRPWGAPRRRHPWPCAWRVGTGWRVRPRRRVRAPWAGGGPDGGRGGRPETDAHRGIIGRSWPAKSPLRARYAAPTRRRPPSTAVRSADPHGPGRSGPTGRLGCPSPPPHSASLSRPPERMWTDGRPPAAAIQEGPLP